MKTRLTGSLRQHFERFEAVARLQDPEAGVGDVLDQHRAHAGVVVHDQDRVGAARIGDERPTAVLDGDVTGPPQQLDGVADGQQRDAVLGGERRLARKLHAVRQLAAARSAHADRRRRAGMGGARRQGHASQHLVVVAGTGSRGGRASRTGERHPGSVALSRHDWPAVVYRSERRLDSACAQRVQWRRSVDYAEAEGRTRRCPDASSSIQIPVSTTPWRSSSCSGRQSSSSRRSRPSSATSTSSRRPETP